MHCWLQFRHNYTFCQGKYLINARTRLLISCMCVILSRSGSGPYHESCNKWVTSRAAGPGTCPTSAHKSLLSPMWAATCSSNRRDSFVGCRPRHPRRSSNTPPSPLLTRPFHWRNQTDWHFWSQITLSWTSHSNPTCNSKIFLPPIEHTQQETGFAWIEANSGCASRVLSGSCRWSSHFRRQNWYWMCLGRFLYHNSKTTQNGERKFFPIFSNKLLLENIRTWKSKPRHQKNRSRGHQHFRFCRSRIRVGVIGESVRRLLSYLTRVQEGSE